MERERERERERETGRQSLKFIRFHGTQFYWLIDEKLQPYSSALSSTLFIRAGSSKLCIYLYITKHSSAFFITPDLDIVVFNKAGSLMYITGNSGFSTNNKVGLKRFKEVFNGFTHLIFRTSSKTSSTYQRLCSSPMAFSNFCYQHSATAGVSLWCNKSRT